MTHPFDEAKVNRAGDGKFASKGPAPEEEVELEPIPGTHLVRDPRGRVVDPEVYQSPPGPPSGFGAFVARDGQRVDDEAASLRADLARAFPSARLLVADEDEGYPKVSHLEDGDGYPVAGREQVLYKLPELDDDLRSMMSSPNEAAVERNIAWSGTDYRMDLPGDGDDEPEPDPWGPGRESYPAGRFGEDLEEHHLGDIGARNHGLVASAQFMDAVRARNPKVVAIGPAVRHGVWSDTNSFDGFDEAGNRIELGDAGRSDALGVVRSSAARDLPWTNQFDPPRARLARADLPTLVKRSEYRDPADLGGPDVPLSIGSRRTPQTAEWSGSNSDRQSVGEPGHCEACAQYGHVAAHPEHGCGDVGCTDNH